MATVNGRDDALVTVAYFDSSLEASLARGALEALDIRAVIPGEALGSFSRNMGGISSTELQVFASDFDRAATALRRLQIRVVERP